MTIDIGLALTLLALAFGAWAWVVAWGADVIRKEMKRTSDATEITGKSLEAHILATERRLTMLETEFSYIRRYMVKRDYDEPE